MRIKKKTLIIKYITIIFLLIHAVNVYPAAKNWQQELEKAEKLYNTGKYEESIALFREIILSSDNTTFKNESYFWLAKAYMGVNKLKQAELNLEYYLTNFKTTGKNYPEAHYQKGRLLFLQEEYQAAIGQLDSFREKYPAHPLMSNAYYWIGESLYALGQFEDSEVMFTIVIKKYLLSTKKEAATYKLRLIEHKKSELALQNLLKWSQEQYLSALNQFKIKERMLTEALEKYRTGTEETNTVYVTNEEELTNIKEENEKLRAEIKSLQIRLEEQGQPSTTEEALNEKIMQLELKEQLLKNKEEALKLIEEELREKEKALEQ